jgi:hypothetical protein
VPVIESDNEEIYASDDADDSRYFTSTAAKEEYGKTDRKAHHVVNPRSH